MNQTLKLQDVLTLEEAARYLRVSKGAVKELAAQGKLPGRQVKGQWRFLKAALQEWLRGRDVLNSRDELLRQAGAFKDDPVLEEIVKEAMRARGRPDPDAVGY